MSDNSLQAFRVYGDPGQEMRLVYHPERSAIDLHQFFDDAFDRRDHWLGGPPVPRVVRDGNSFVYSASLVDLIETFCHAHPPEELASYLEAHLEENNDSSEALLRRIRHASEQVSMVYLEDHVGRSGSFRHAFGPINCELEELCNHLSRGRLKKRIKGNEPSYFLNDEPPRNWFGNIPMKRLKGADLRPNRIKAAFSGMDRPVAMLFSVGRYPERLHDAYIMAYYRMDTAGVKLARDE